MPTRTNVLKHDSEVGNSDPIKQHIYRVNTDKRAWLKKQVEYMLANGIAEPSSNIVLSDGSDRFCTDYRKVNSVPKPDCFPLPRMDDFVVLFAFKARPFKVLLAGGAN